MGGGGAGDAGEEVVMQPLACKVQTEQGWPLSANRITLTIVG